MSYDSSLLKISTGDYCAIYREETPIFFFYCSISRDSTITITFASGSFINAVGMTNDPVSFSIVHSSVPLNATLTWRSLLQIPIRLRIHFTQVMDWDTVQIQNWLVMTNAVIDQIQSYSDDEVEILIVPKQQGEIHVVLSSSCSFQFVSSIAINNTLLKSRCGNALEGPLTTSTRTSFTAVYTHLVTHSTTNCQAPLPVYAFFSEPVNFTASALSLENGDVLSDTHLTTPPSFSADPSMDDSFDVYLFYIKPSTSHVTTVSVVLPPHALRSSEGRFNAQSNHLTLSFVRDEDGVTCLSSPFTNRNPYEVIVQYPYAISGVVATKAIDVEGCKVMDTSLVGTNRLRVVLEIESEGEGSMTIPSGLSLSLNGVVSEQFVWNFTYGRSEPMI